MSSESYYPDLYPTIERVEKKSKDKKAIKRARDKVLRRHARLWKKLGKSYKSYREAPPQEKLEVDYAYYKELIKILKNEEKGKESRPDVSEKEKDYVEGMRAWSKEDIVTKIERAYNPREFKKEVFEIRDPNICEKCGFRPCICGRKCPNCGDLLDNNGMCWGCGYGVNG